MATTAKKLSKRVRSLAHRQTKQTQALRHLGRWPHEVGTIQAQLASVYVVLEVYQEELELLGAKDLKAKVNTKATKLLEQFKAQANAAPATK